MAQLLLGALRGAILAVASRHESASRAVCAATNERLAAGSGSGHLVLWRHAARGLAPPRLRHVLLRQLCHALLDLKCTAGRGLLDRIVVNHLARVGSRLLLLLSTKLILLCHGLDGPRAVTPCSLRSQVTRHLARGLDRYSRCGLSLNLTRLLHLLRAMTRCSMHKVILQHGPLVRTRWLHGV